MSRENITEASLEAAIQLDLARAKGVTELESWHLQMLILAIELLTGMAQLFLLLLDFFFPLIVCVAPGFPRSTFDIAKRSSLDLSQFEAQWLRRVPCSCHLLQDGRCGSSIDAQPTEKNIFPILVSAHSG